MLILILGNVRCFDREAFPYHADEREKSIDNPGGFLVRFTIEINMY